MINLGTKEKIIKIALKQALEQGYDNTSMSKIAREVGISKPAIYHHFANKEDLFQQALDYFLAKLAQFTENQFQDCTTLQEFLQRFFTSFENVKNMVKSMIRGSDIKTAYSFLELNISASKHNENTRKRMANGYQMTRINFKNLVVTAQKNGEIRNDIDPETFAFMMLSIIEGLSLQKWFDDSFSLDNTGKKIYENLWNMIKIK